MLNPKPWQIAPRLFWPALALCLASALAGQVIMFLDPSAFTRHFLRNNTVLAAVHLTSLGFLASLFLAVSMQALNVVLHQRAARPLVSLLGWALFFSGAVGLVVFLGGTRRVPLLACALGGLGSGYGLLAWRAWRLARQGEGRGTAWQGLADGFFYLGVMVALGVSMAAGMVHPWLPQPALSTIVLHLHLGLAGFAGLAILGMLPKLLRLFLGAKGYPTWPGRVSRWGVHTGLMLHLLGWLLGREVLIQAGSVVLFGAALCFGLQLIYLARSASKPVWTSNFSTQLLGVLCMVVAAGWDAWLCTHDAGWRLAAASVYLALFGWIGSVILGTAQRIVAVLAWFQRFFEEVPSQVVPTAWDLIDAPLAWCVPLLMFSATFCGTFGIAMGSVEAIRFSGILGAASFAVTLGLAGRALVKGKPRPFPGGISPYSTES